MENMILDFKRGNSMFNVRAEFESAPIRHISVQCPKCNNWFRGEDITNDDLRCELDINYAVFECPVCNKRFGGIQHADPPKIKEVYYPDVYDGCLEQKIVWE